MYTAGFKEAMVEKMLVPGGPRASQFAKGIGICQPTLSRWKKAYGKVEGMARTREDPRTGVRRRSSKQS